MAQSKCDLKANSCIIYRVSRFDLDKSEWEDNYGFAMHPLIQVEDEHRFVCEG